MSGLDHYAIESADHHCAKLFDQPKSAERLLEIITKLERKIASAKEWRKTPNIPFSMGSMDERDLGERIADHDRYLPLLEQRVENLKSWI
jgi:hypothetical protein